MAQIKPFKVEFIDKDTMCRVDDIWKILVELDPDTGELKATLIEQDPRLDKQLEIRIKEKQ